MSLGNKQVVSREEWIEARRAFLAKEKEFTRQRDELSRRRRELPWVKVEENYVFDYLDLTPKGRDEDGLAFTMAWVRHHDRYGAGYTVDTTATYSPPKGSTCSHCSEEGSA